jgi:hypothetical protein
MSLANSDMGAATLGWLLSLGAIRVSHGIGGQCGLAHPRGGP